MIINPVDIVNLKIPFLLNLNTNTKYKMNVHTVHYRSCIPYSNINLPLTRKNGHSYLEWGKQISILFTQAELLKLQRGYSHPVNEKLLNLLCLARPNHLNSETKELLKDLSKHRRN